MLRGDWKGNASVGCSLCVSCVARTFLRFCGQDFYAKHRLIANRLITIQTYACAQVKLVSSQEKKDSSGSGNGRNLEIGRKTETYKVLKKSNFVPIFCQLLV